MDTGDSRQGGATVADGPTVAVLLARAASCGLTPLDAQLLLARATGWSRAQLFAHDDRVVGPQAVARFTTDCARRADDEPLAYIEGHKEFWSLDLVVTPDTLVPRPETEGLVELCLAALAPTAQRVADLGTGSGAIALALAHERPDWSITAVDASAAALLVAQGNAERLGLRNVTFQHGNWCAPLDGDRFDAILSNPPYIDPDDAALKALRHEPLSALAAADEGYADLLAIADGARAWLKPGGVLMLEHGATQAPRLGAELVARGYARVVCHPDLAGLPRVTAALWTGTHSSTI